MGLVKTLSIDIQPNSIECHYAECRDYLNVILSVVRLNVVEPMQQSSNIFLVAKQCNNLYLGFNVIWWVMEPYCKTKMEVSIDEANTVDYSIAVKFKSTLVFNIESGAFTIKLYCCNYILSNACALVQACRSD